MKNLIKVYLPIVLVTLMLTEGTAFGVLVLQRTNTGFNNLIGSIDYYLKKHPWSGYPWRSYLNSDFHPLVVHRNRPLWNIGDTELRTNEFGIIHNGSNNPILNAFPEKPDGVLRVLMFGGSTVAGWGETNTTTISAYLERTLNETNKESGLHIQVINYGTPSQNILGEIATLMSEAIYLKPDLVIHLDGMNDLRMVDTPEFNTQRLSVSLINWSDGAHYAFDAIHGYGSSLSAPLPMFYYTSTLLYRLIKPSEVSIKENPERIENYRALASYKFSVWNQEQYPFHENVLRTNFELLAAMLSHRGIPLLAYLQPYSAQFKDLEPEKAAGIDLVSETVTASMNKGFDIFAKEYTKLDRLFGSNSILRFQDIRRLFSNVSQVRYHDSMHYNAAGNREIAERIATDIILSNGVIELSQP